MKTTTIQNAKSLSFEHRTDTVDVHIYNENEERIMTVKNVDADTFLAHFDYGTIMYNPSIFVTDLGSVMREFLSVIL